MTLLVIYFLLALIISFICSIAEAVLLSVRPSYIASLQLKDKRLGKLLRKQKEHIDQPLAAILSLNTIANTFGAAGVGAQAADVWSNTYVGLASAVLTLAILVFSEVIPKTIGALHWRKLAPIVSQALRVMIWLIYPLVFLLEKLTKLLSRGRAHLLFSREEFAAMADLGVEHGQLQSQESRILKNMLRLISLKADDIMTPRTVVLAFQESLTVAEVLKKHPEINFSRIPIFTEHLDDTTGFVLKNDILLEHAKGMTGTTLSQLKREFKAVPDSVSISDLFELFLDARAHIALVVDEYGGMVGVVTLEDVVETLLGLEIVDEADKTVDMRELARAQWKKRSKALGIDADSNSESANNEDDRE